MEQLKQIYGKYVEDLNKVYKGAKPMDGLFGWGDDPRKDPCHMRFYEDVERWTGEFPAAGPDNAAVYEAVCFILETPDRYREHPCYWFMFAAHSLTRDLIGLLRPEQCARLREMYDDRFPRRERMPAQKDVYKLLKKGAGR